MACKNTPDGKRSGEPRGSICDIPTTFSIEEPTSYINNKRSPIKLSYKERQSKTKINVVVTQHITNPCPRYFTDIFETILIECKDPEHQTLSTNKKANAV